MTTIRPDDPGLVRTSTLDLPPDQVSGVVAHLSQASEALAGEQGSGLLTSTVLVSRAAPGAQGDPVRVVHLTRWASPALADAARDALSPTGPASPQVRPDHDLELRAMHTAAAQPHLELCQDGGPATFLISMDSDPSEHEGLLTLNLDDTEAVFSRLPGFVAGTFYSDSQRRRLFEVVQWQTMGDFFAAASSPAFAEHDTLIQQRCHATDARAYDVVHTTEEMTWPPSPAARG